MKNSGVLPLVEYINNRDNNRYGLNMKIETPTFNQYLKNNVKNCDLDFLEKLGRFIGALTCSGYTDDETGEIFVFNKNYALIYKFNDPFDYLGIPNLGDVLVAMVAFHEIRHVLQDNRLDMFNEYEFFCINYLKVLNNRYIFDIDFHDSQYFEIDANLYSANEAKELFTKNKRINKFLDDQVTLYTYQKCLYEFEEFLNYFIKTMKDGEYFDTYDNDDFMRTFWNIDGSFKTLTEMLNNPNFLYGGLLESRIVTSDAFLSALDFNKLSYREKRALSVHIDKNIKFIASNVETLDNLYKDKKISKSRYKDGLEFLKEQICLKEEYKNRIGKAKIVKKRGFYRS